jgi:hypothetical protein
MECLSGLRGYKYMSAPLCGVLSTLPGFDVLLLYVVVSFVIIFL